VRHWTAASTHAVSLRRLHDFAVDTAVTGRDGRYSGALAEGWEIWGPQGGYVAGVALRSAGAEASFSRPASVACHFLRPAQVGRVDVHVESLRRTRRAESLRVTLRQNDAKTLEALVWTIDELSGIDHAATAGPDVPRPEELQPWERFLPGGEAPFPFWLNFDVRPVAPHPSEWGQTTEPRSLSWTRLRVMPDLDDPFLDAARLLVAADSAMYPAAMFAHEGRFPYVAPSLDLVMSFHLNGADSDWLLVDAVSPLSAGGLVAGQASIWSSDGRRLASAMQQMLQRTSPHNPPRRR
jgi:acyl-CoA thioesterase II